MKQMKAIIISVVISLTLVFFGYLLIKDGMTGEQGVQGEQGLQGATGTVGIAGTSGTQTTIYQTVGGKWMTICIDGGNLGTDRFWCDSKMKIWTDN